jgi:hypothetical protein
LGLSWDEGTTSLCCALSDSCHARRAQVSLMAYVNGISGADGPVSREASCGLKLQPLAVRRGHASP